MVYKLYYFNITALAEPIRMLFSYGNIDFEDIRVAKEDWPAVKETMPMGQMPVLEIDGKKVHQSISICRYLAKKVGLSGSTDFESFEIDAAVDTVNDLRQKIAIVAYEPNEAIKEEKLKTLNSVTIPFYLKKLEEMAKENNGHLALNRTTWADVWFTGVSQYMNFMAKQDLTANHSNLKKVIDNVMAIENIKKYVAKRPKTDA